MKSWQIPESEHGTCQLCFLFFDRISWNKSHRKVIKKLSESCQKLINQLILSRSNGQRATPVLSLFSKIKISGGKHLIFLFSRHIIFVSCWQWKASPDCWFFMLLLRNIRSRSVSFYFSVHENRVLSTWSSFIRSTYVKDVMSWERSCGAESDCSTANYNSEENKCDLFKDRIKNKWFAWNGHDNSKRILFDN